MRAALFLAVSLLGLIAQSSTAVEIRGRVVDSKSKQTLPARIYIHHLDTDKWFHARSADKAGSAVPYNVRRFTKSFEIHTTISAHPFVADVPPGKIEILVEHGPEFTSSTWRGTVAADGLDDELVLPIRRWIHMAKDGWFSGDTHVHRELKDLPNIILAEDLNVALPLSYWVTKGETPPAAGKRLAPLPEAELIEVDADHFIYPMNTEYEIFTMGGKGHTLGAVFVLNHKEPFQMGAPPVAPIAAEARRQGALLDLDKHNWQWSMMIVPIMGVDLFELANNHIWRTEFGFRAWQPVPAPAFMNIESEPGSNNAWTERGWIDFGFKSYYALLNCGFRLRPTAGTASGVHPVPLGFGRVYVNVGGKFDYQKWIDGLDAGNTFVTTGSLMPRLKIGGQQPGFTHKSWGKQHIQITGEIRSLTGLERVEAIVNGNAISIDTKNSKALDGGSYVTKIDARIPVGHTSWVAVRAFEKRADRRPRYCHTAPTWVEVDGEPLKAKAQEVNWLVSLMDQQIQRSQGVLSDEALEEYKRAKEIYQSLLE